MIKMYVAPVSAIAWFVLIAIALRYCWLGEPNTCRAVAAKDEHGKVGSGLRAAELGQQDVRTVVSSSLITLL
jgi:hypothetical protein